MVKNNWTPFLEIPEATKGKFAIEHRTIAPGEKIPLTNMRTAIFAGLKPKSVVYDSPVTFHFLTEEGGTWTSDLPCEQEQQLRVVKGFKGRVLVGGLGIGMIAVILANMPQVTEVVVVEIQKEVIDLVWKHIEPMMKGKGHIVKMSLFQYLRQTFALDEKFDYAFYDIWTSDGEGTLAQTVLPLRHLSKGIVKDKNITCWNEDVMWGQVLNGILTKCSFDYDKFLKMPEDRFEKFAKDWANPATPLWRWARRHDIKKETVMAVAQVYCTTYGSSTWKKKWGTYVD